MSGVPRRGIVIATSLLLFAAGCDRSPSAIDASRGPALADASKDAPAEAAPQYVTLAADPSRDVAVVSVRGFGTMRIELFADRAPRTVAAFETLAAKGFYDGTTFHRVVPGSMIQGGDPNSRNRDPRDDGQGGPDFRLPAELSDIDHRRGIVALARGAQLDTGGSQFFVCVADRPDLNGQYTAFGRVLEGLDVADRIAAVPRDEFGRRGPVDRPLENVVIESIRIERAADARPATKSAEPAAPTDGPARADAAPAAPDSRPATGSTPISSTLPARTTPMLRSSNAPVAPLAAPNASG